MQSETAILQVCWFSSSSIQQSTKFIHTGKDTFSSAIRRALNTQQTPRSGWCQWCCAPVQEYSSKDGCADPLKVTMPRTDI
jgi:hypothetical protein